MIVFDLKCGAGHVFEAWFASSPAFEDQRERGLLACPTCGLSDVDKAVMAPRVGTKGNRSVAAPPGTPPATGAAKAMLAAIATAQAEALSRSRWVGSRFADEARVVHESGASEEVIHGQATPEEARALADEGIAVMPLLVPVVPPETLN